MKLTNLEAIVLLLADRQESVPAWLGAEKTSRVCDSLRVKGYLNPGKWEITLAGYTKLRELT